MAHEHAHGGGHHHHGVSPAADRRWLAIALATVLAFMVVEVVAGVLASSLALLSDAAHMLTDAGAIALALVAARLAARPARGRFTFGLGRAEILSAQVNGGALLVLAGVIAVEAIARLSNPSDADGAFVLAVGLAGAGGSGSRRPPTGSTPPPSATRSRPSPASSRSTTSTSGRSPRASRHSRRTCWCGPATTATRRAAGCRRWSASTSASTT